MWIMFAIITLYPSIKAPSVILILFLVSQSYFFCLYFVEGCPLPSSICGTEPEDTCSSDFDCSSGQKCCQIHACRPAKKCIDIRKYKLATIKKN